MKFKSSKWLVSNSRFKLITEICYKEISFEWRNDYIRIVNDDDFYGNITIRCPIFWNEYFEYFSKLDYVKCKSLEEAQKLIDKTIKDFEICQVFS